MTIKPAPRKPCAGISTGTLLLQAQQLLNDADEANHGGDYSTFDLQRQARAVLAEAIDQAAQVRHSHFMRSIPCPACGTDWLRERGEQPLAVHPYHETQE